MILGQILSGLRPSQHDGYGVDHIAEGVSPATLVAIITGVLVQREVLDEGLDRRDSTKHKFVEYRDEPQKYIKIH